MAMGRRLFARYRRLPINYLSEIKVGGRNQPILQLVKLMK